MQQTNQDQTEKGGKTDKPQVKTVPDTDAALEKKLDALLQKMQMHKSLVKKISKY